MDFFIKETNVRGGNRCGKNLFNWDDVRLLSNRDRQSYLGSTQALGLMDRGGKWYRRDWWTHYNNQVNVYGHKDKLNNRTALLDEQKEIRKKEKEKLYEFIYGKKKKNNNNLSLNLNDGESIKEQLSKIQSEKNLSTKSENGDLSRPGLGLIKQMNLENEISFDKDKIFENKKKEDIFLGKKIKNNDNYNEKKLMGDDKSSKRHSHHHHHHHHKHNHHHNKSKNKNKKIKDLENNNKSKEYSKD